MTQQNKARLWKELKAAGVQFDHPYGSYTEAALQQASDALRRGAGALPGVERREAPSGPQEPAEAAPPPDAEAAHFFGFDADPVDVTSPELPGFVMPPVAPKDPDEMAGARQNTYDEWDPIRTDEEGRIWYQEEVLKPAFPKPRGRRVLTYQDAGARQVTVQDGQYTETFEVSGDPSQARLAEVKITLPSYQVGIYADRRFPFRVVTYNGMNGFHLQDVQDFYGGAELVPAEVKRAYVENVLCYDIRTTVRAIQDEHRRLQLANQLPA